MIFLYMQGLFMGLVDTLSKINEISDRLRMLHAKDKRSGNVSSGQRGDIGAGKDRVWLASSLSAAREEHQLSESE